MRHARRTTAAPLPCARERGSRRHAFGRARRARPRAGRSVPRPERRSVAAEEEVAPPGLVVLVREVRREERVDVAPRLERRPDEVHPHLIEELPALAMVAGLAGRDEVLPGV